MKIGRATVSMDLSFLEDMFSIDNSRILCDNKQLSCNIISIFGDDTIVFIIAIDLLWLDNVLSAKIQNEISSQYHVPSTNIILSATHTHSCPYIDPVTYKNNYIELGNRVFNAVMSSIEHANMSAVDGFMHVHSFETKYTVNRRKNIVNHKLLRLFKYVKEIRNRPNVKKTVDQTSLALMFYEYPRRPIALLLNYSAHPVLASQSRCSADYPGELSKFFKSYYDPEFVTCFMQGFSGNVKPNLWEYGISFKNKLHINLFNILFDRKKFKQNLSSELINNYALSITKEILNSDYSKTIHDISVSSDLAGISIEHEDHKDDLLVMKKLDLTKSLRFVCVNSEIFNEYSIWMRKHSMNNDHILVTVSCCGGMIGYIPTANAIKEGGYEVDGCLNMFGHQRRYLLNIEDKIMASFEQLFNYK